MTTSDLDDPGRQCAGPLEFVARDDDRRARPSSVAQHTVEFVATGRIESGVGFVEQPHRRPARHQTGECDAASLARTEPIDREGREAIPDSHPLHGRSHLGRRCTDRRPPEGHVLGDRQLAIQTIGVSQEPDERSDCSGVHHEIDTGDLGRAALHGQQASTHPQQGSLPRTVRTTQEHDLAAFDDEGRSGEDREPVHDRDHVDETDDGLHENDTLTVAATGLPRQRRVASADVNRAANFPYAKPTSPATPSASGSQSPFERPRRTSYFDRPRQPRDWRWVVGGVGRSLIVTGVLLFGFVAYQLWGTGLQTARAQGALEDQFAEQFSEVTTTSPQTTTGITIPSDTPTTTTIPTATDNGPVDPGTPLGKLRIPAIGVDMVFVEGVQREELKKGPGHFPESPLPGQLGNSAIAGHRTTYGAPFFDLDKLQPGDVIETRTLTGTYIYLVDETLVIEPDDYVEVVPTRIAGRATLTLMTCHPAYTTRQRLIVRATLDAEASDQVYYPVPRLLLSNPSLRSVLPSLDDSSAPATTAVTSTTMSMTATSIASGDPTATIEPAPTTVPSTTPPTSAGESESGLGGDPGADEVEGELAAGWFEDTAAIPHVLGWGALLAAIAFGAYHLGRWRRRLWVSFAVGAIPFIVGLYFWYENLNRLLPPDL